VHSLKVTTALGADMQCVHVSRHVNMCCNIIVQRLSILVEESRPAAQLHPTFQAALEAQQSTRCELTMEKFTVCLLLTWRPAPCLPQHLPNSAKVH
jgi:hypothetical protein